MLYWGHREAILLCIILGNQICTLSVLFHDGAVLCSLILHENCTLKKYSTAGKMALAGLCSKMTHIFFN